MNDTTFTMRIPKKLKQDAEVVFESVGLDLPTAFRVFMKASVRSNGIPFSLKNVDENGFTPEEVEEIQETMLESRDPKNTVATFDDAESMIKFLSKK